MLKMFLTEPEKHWELLVTLPTGMDDIIDWILTMKKLIAAYGFHPSVTLSIILNSGNLNSSKVLNCIEKLMFEETVVDERR